MFARTGSDLLRAWTVAESYRNRGNETPSYVALVKRVAPRMGRGRMPAFIHQTFIGGQVVSS